MALAVNDAGDVLTDASGSWKPAPRAVNDATGESMVLDGGAWKPAGGLKAAPPPVIPGAQPEASGEQPAAPAPAPEMTAPKPTDMYGSTTPDPAPGAAGRILSAAEEGWRGGGFQTPEAADRATAENQQTWVGRNIVEPAVSLSNVPFRALGAVGGGMSQAAVEAGTAVGRPELGRDLNMLAQVAPMAHVPGVSPGSTVAGIRQALTRDPIAAIGAASDVNGAIEAAGVAAKTPMGDVGAALAPAESPQLRLLRQTEGAILRRVDGDETRLTEVDQRRLVSLRALMEQVRGLADDIPTLTVTAAAPDVAAKQIVTAIPKTSAEAKAVATAYYQRADQVGGTLLPEFTNKFIDEAESIAPQTIEGRAIAGDTAITGLVDRIQALRDQPISLRGAQEIDERLGDLIDKEFGLKGLSKEGRNLLDLQTTFRNMILDAGPGDTTNGVAGFEAIKQGRIAWAQAMKMMDFERILNRADQTDNPVTSIRAGIRTLTSNPARVRGYSAEEIEALKDAANRGAIGSVLHVFGSRLMPLAVGAAGLSTGVIPGLIGAGITHGAAAGMRNLATRMQLHRADNAMSVLGSGVPSMPSKLSSGTSSLLIPAPTVVRGANTNVLERAGAAAD